MKGSAELILGIDFGMSGTAVAFWQRHVQTDKTEEHDRPKPTLLRAWPSKPENLTGEIKVPTRLGYEHQLDGTGELRSWGFGCDTNDDNLVVVDCFKTKLSKDRVDPCVHKHFLDYLACLYKFLAGHFALQTEWLHATIDFRFSVPAAWDQRTTDFFAKIAAEAGFGEGTNHSVSTSLTEPQAVAIYELLRNKALIGVTSPVLFVDAGAGTTDLCLLKLDQASGMEPKAIGLKPTVGVNTGSMCIDLDFRDFAKEMLTARGIAQQHLGRSPDQTAWQMSKLEVFQTAKCSLGGSNEQAKAAIPIPGCHSSVEDAHITLYNDKLKSFFHEQLKGVQNELTTMISDRIEFDPKSAPSLILLSGGLGSSPYIQSRLSEFCSRNPCLAEAKLLLSEEPRAAVCLGLVHFALQSPRLSLSYCARASFGVYRRAGVKVSQAIRKVRKEAFKRDAQSKPIGVSNWKLVQPSVDWLIKQGDEMDATKLVTREYEAPFPAETPMEKRICLVKIMTSPNSDPSDQGKRYTSMRVDLSQISAAKYQHVNTKWHLGPVGMKHKVRFLVRATIGPAQVKFECLDLDNTTVLAEAVTNGLPEEAGEEDCLPVAGDEDDYVEIDAC